MLCFAAGLGMREQDMQFEPMPGSWPSTAKSQKNWVWLQKSYHFLRARQCENYGQLHCYICGLQLEIVEWYAPQNSPRKATVDHFIPRSKGGPDDWSNLRVCCAPCNYKKGCN